MAGCFSCFLPFSGDNNERKRFLEAAKSGDDQVAATMAASKPELVTSTTLLQRKTALHLAAENGHAGVMASILEMLLCQASLERKGGAIHNGADAETTVSSIINSRDADGRTPLITACGHNHVECVRLLLSNGAWREPVDSRGNSAVHYAAAKGYLGVLLTLMTEFLDELVVEQRHAAGAENAGEGTLPNVKRLADVRNAAGFAPLHYAVWAKQSASVQILLQHGADLIPRNPRAGMEASIPCLGGSTPLHLAAMRGHIEISRLLLKTHYERVLEPMQLAAASTGQDVSRSILEVDPRTQVNSAGLVPYKVAQRAGFLSLASLLRPHIPLARLFNEEEHRVRFYGPPALKLLAAEALNRKLLAALDRVMSEDKATAPADPIIRSTSPGIPAGANGHEDPVSTNHAASVDLPCPQPHVMSHDSSVRLPSSSGAGIALATVQEEEHEESSSHNVSPTANSISGPLSSREHSSKTGLDDQGTRRSNSCSTSGIVSPFAAISLDPAGITPSPEAGLRDGLLSSGTPHDLHDLQLLPLPGTCEETPLAMRPARPLSRGQQEAPVSTRPASYSHAPTSPVNMLNNYGRDRAASQSSSGAVGLALGLTAARSGFATLTPRCSAAELNSLLEDGAVLTTMRSLPPGVVALQRGTSITLMGAMQLAGPTDMAALTGLDQLADVVEDQPTPALHRSRMSSNCLPMLSGTPQPGAQHDDDEVEVPPMAASGALTRRGSADRDQFPDIHTPLTSPHHNGSVDGQAHIASPPPRVGSSRRSLSGLRKAVSSALGSVEEITHESATAQISTAAASSITTTVGLLMPAAAQASATTHVPNSSVSNVPAIQGMDASVAITSNPHVHPVHASISEDDDDECGVCLEYMAHVLVQPCQHTICGPCAKKMCSMNASRTPHCPFCRALISDFCLVPQP